MNKKFVFVLFVLLMLLPIDCVYAITVKKIDTKKKLIDEISLPTNTKYIYFDYKKERVYRFSVSPSATTYFGEYLQSSKYPTLYFKNFKVTKKKKKNKTSYLSGSNTFSNIGSIIIPKIGYYIDYNENNTDGKVWLNLTINVDKVEIEFFGSCSKKYYYPISMFNPDTRKFSASIWRHSDLSKDKVASGENKSCNINGAFTYGFRFSRTDGKKLPNNLTYLWKITDLDQPQDYLSKKSSFDGKYAESITFGKDFYPTFYVYNGTKLKYKNDSTKFVGTKQTCDDKGKPDGCIQSYQTVVYAFQKGASVNVTWKGSRDIGTTLIGTPSNFTPPPPPVLTPVCESKSGKYYDDDGKEVDEVTFIKKCKYKYKLNTCKMNANRSDEDSNSIADITVPCGSKTQFFDQVAPVAYFKYDDTFDNTPYIDHSSCIYDKTQISGKLYEKVDGNNEIVMLDNDNMVHDVPANRCVPVDISVQTVLTEDIEFNINDIAESKIYAGGGFSWPGSSASSSFKWVPNIYRSGISTDDYKILFTVIHHYVEKKGKKDLTSDKHTISSINLYTDSNCGNKLTENELEGFISSDVTNKTSRLSGHDLSFRASSGSNSVTNSDVSMNLNEKVDKSISNSISTSVSLKHAYINRKSALIEYESDGKKFGDDYVDAGVKYYIPLKYTDSVFSIKMNQVDISALKQGLYVKTSCDIDVIQIYYDKKKNSNGGLAYKYRPIKVNDVFNGKNRETIAKNAQNWAKWYCTNDNCNDDSSSNINRKRIGDTYQNKLYSISLDKDNIDKISSYNNTYNRYNNFDTIKIDGSSEFVSREYGFTLTANNRSYCGLGVFSNSCDVALTGGES